VLGINSLINTGSVLSSVIADLPGLPPGAGGAAASHEDDPLASLAIIGTASGIRQVEKPSGRIRDCYIHSYTYHCARLAAGCAADLAGQL
jgi:hypothetical protein